MLEQDREKSNSTCEMINNCVDMERRYRDIILKNQKKRLELTQKIKRYVKIVYYKIFEWESVVNQELLKTGTGMVNIEISDEMPWMFPINDLHFVEFPAKDFSYLTGKLIIKINTSEIITLEADLLFRWNYGTIKWKDGSESYFICDRHRAEDMSEFGNRNILDLLSKLMNWQIQQDNLGKYITARHPSDAINDKLSATLFAATSKNSTKLNYIL